MEWLKWKNPVMFCDILNNTANNTDQVLSLMYAVLCFSER